MIEKGAGSARLSRVGGLARGDAADDGGDRARGALDGGLPPLFGFIGKELIYEATGAAAWPWRRPAPRSSPTR